jgi:urease accessory protein
VLALAYVEGGSAAGGGFLAGLLHPVSGIDHVAASGLLLGLAVLFSVRVPLWAALLPVSVFAVFHGHAHGTEMPDYGAPLLYAAGFVLATGALHLCGISIGLLWCWPPGQWLVRASGGLVAGVGGFQLLT